MQSRIGGIGEGPSEMNEIGDRYLDLGPGRPRTGHTDMSLDGDKLVTSAETTRRVQLNNDHDDDDNG